MLIRGIASGQRITRSALLWEAECLKKSLSLRPFFALSPRKLTNFRHPRKKSDDCLGQRAETHRGPERHETPLRGEESKCRRATDRRQQHHAREYARLKGGAGAGEADGKHYKILLKMERADIARRIEERVA